MGQGLFGTVINCMDGRIQAPARRFLVDRFAVDYVDTITAAGPIRTLSEGHPEAVMAGIQRRLRVSIEGHHSCKVALVAHALCAGNPVDREVQMIQLEKSLQVIRGWFPTVEVIGIWIEPMDGVWVVEEVL